MAELSAFNPTGIIGDVPVMKVNVDGKNIWVDAAGERVLYNNANPVKKYVAPVQETSGTDIAATDLVLNAVPGTDTVLLDCDFEDESEPEYPRETVDAKVAAVAFSAVHIPGGTKYDDMNNMAMGLGNGLVELAICQKDGAHRRLIVRLPATVELEIVEEL